MKFPAPRITASDSPSPACRLCDSADHPTAQCHSIAPLYREIGRWRLLSREESIAAIQEIERLELDLWTRALKLRPDWPGYEGLPPEKARDKDIDRIEIRKLIGEINRPALSRRLTATDKARSAFLNANLRLVIRIATCYLGHGFPIQDLIQEGTFGLMRGLANFQWRRGFAFSTYASWWVRHAIMRALANGRQDVRVPVHAQTDRASFQKHRGQLAASLGRMPSDDEVIESMGLTPRQAARVLFTHYAYSLDTPLRNAGVNDEVHTYADLMADDAPSPQEQAETAERVALARRLVEQLPPHQQEIIKARFGIGTGEEKLRELGARLGVCRERVRQIECDALRTLRRHVKRGTR